MNEGTSIDLELEKANFTDGAIQEMKDSFMGLKVKDRTDNEGFEAVSEARKKVKGFRVALEKFAKELRNPAFLFQKAVIAKEKDFVVKLEEIEDYLQSQEDVMNPKVEDLMTPMTDQEKIVDYVRSLLKVKVPVMETEEGNKMLLKVTGRLNLIGVDII